MFFPAAYSLWVFKGWRVLKCSLYKFSHNLRASQRDTFPGLPLGLGANDRNSGAFAASYQSGLVGPMGELLLSHNIHFPLKPPAATLWLCLPTNTALDRIWADHLEAGISLFHELWWSSGHPTLLFRCIPWYPAFTTTLQLPRHNAANCFVGCTFTSCLFS